MVLGKMKFIILVLGIVLALSFEGKSKASIFYILLFAGLFYFLFGGRVIKKRKNNMWK